MAQDMLGITNSLFGVQPTPQADFARGMQLAGRSATDIGTGLAFAGGAQLGRGLMAATGTEDPEMASANRAKQFAQELQSQGLSMQSAEGMNALAQKLSQAGDFKAAQVAAAVANKFASDRASMDVKTADIGLKEAQTVKALREPTRTAMSSLIASGKYTPASVAAYEKSQNPADLVLVVKKGKGDGEGDGGGVGIAGPVGKSGAYRDADGIVYSATEMAKQRAGFQGLEKLADSLNSITEQDVKNAESFIDYTQGETLKTIGGKVSPKTISAQAKINASQLLKQIESLPPGSASNADMIAAKSSFPGYGNADNLNKWIKDTKKLLAASLQRQSEQYGFKQKVPVTGLDGATPTANTAPKTRTLKSGVVVTVEGN